MPGKSFLYTSVALALGVLVGPAAVTAVKEAKTGKKAPAVAVEPLIKGKLRHTVVAADGRGKVVREYVPTGRPVTYENETVK